MRIKVRKNNCNNDGEVILSLFPAGAGVESEYFLGRKAQQELIVELLKCGPWSVGQQENIISCDMTRLENLLSNLARDVGKLTLKTDVMDQQLTKMKQEIMELQNAPPTELQFRRSYTYGDRITCLEGDMKILKRGYNIYGKSYPEAVKGLEAQLKSLEHMFQTTVGPATDKATNAAMKVERFDASIKILEEKVKELVAWTHLEEVKTGEDDPDDS